MSTKIVEKRLSIKPDEMFGYWKVLKYSGIRGYYTCQCVCGKTKDITTSTLKGGHSKSCGCKMNTFAVNRRLPENLALKRLLLHRYKKSAKERGHSFDLQLEDFINKVESNCYYCNSSREESINFISNSKDESYKYQYNGIDRVDNTKGYSNDNTVPCCTKCNLAKRQMNISEFKQWIISIYENFIKEPSTTILQGSTLK